MTQMPTPRKHPSQFATGEEFKPVQYEMAREMVDFTLIAINDRHPWYTEASPFGPPVIPLSMAHMAWIRLTAKHMWDDYVGAIFTQPAGLHYTFDAEYIDAVRVGEKVTVKGKCSANYVKRGRRYVDYETEIYGEDGRLCIKYVSTSLPGYRKENE